MKNIFFIFSLTLLATNSNGQSDQQIENLKTFSRVYGYVKYFHPSDEAASIDWDKFAIYGSSRIEKCKNTEELLSTLNELFKPLAPTVSFNKASDQIKFDIKSITPKNANKYETTYWQHYGLSLGMTYKDQVYQSVRINRKTAVEKMTKNYSDFGNLMTLIDAQKYIGKEIKLSGKVRLKEGTKGTGHLWLRVDLQNTHDGFFENMDDNPITKNSWEEYEIIGQVDSTATKIVYGCFLQDNGELLVDDIKLSYRENDKWIEIPVKNSNFETEELGVSIKTNQWLYRGGNYSIKIVSGESIEGEKCVSIKKIDNNKIVNGKKIFNKEIQIGEAIQKEIGNGLTCIIPLALYCNKENTFPKSDVQVLNKSLENVNGKTIDLPLRLGDVINCWNVFQHFYPYFDVIPVDWNHELELALKKCYQDSSREDFLITLQKLTAKLKDGHVWVWTNSVQTFQPPIEWAFVENQLVITKICADNIPMKPGDIVTKIDGKNPVEFFSEIESGISAATPGWLAYRANTMTLLGEKGSKLNIEVNNKPVEVTRSKSASEEYCSKKHPSEYKFLENNIIYMNLDLIPMRIIDNLMPQLTKAKAIICDLRGYPNENHDFISHLLTKNDKDKWMYIPEYVYPDRENSAGYDGAGWDMKKKKPYLSSKIIFIIDGSAISYAESFMGFIEGYKLATIVGQPTAGTNGNVNPFVLPGYFNVTWTGMKVLKHDGTQQHAIGILPNVYVTKTIKGVSEGRDEFLEKAIEIANQ